MFEQPQPKIYRQPSHNYNTESYKQLLGAMIKTLWEVDRKILEIKEDIERITYKVEKLEKKGGE